MRLNIEIDEKLLRTAMRIAKTRTKRETVEQALRMLVRLKAQERLRRFRGKVKWEGNLAESRTS
jgi:Arc/MetJ family transcription regulator